MEYLNHIPAIVLEETLLTSFDVTSLYTNIPHDLGLTAVKYWIEEKRDEIDSRFETNFILEATKIVLEENTFYFDGNKYRQIKGSIEAKLHEMCTQDTKKIKAVWQKHQKHFNNYEMNYCDESIMKLKPQQPARTKRNNDIHMNNNTNTGTYDAVASKSNQKKIDNTALRNNSSKRPNTQSRNPSPENFQQNNDEWKVVNKRED
ncbi:unnamed protein product [Mytilus edulis]|uniref:Reverse transcriptase domain-containing protein n=1 Tax=Mytilus edulis TaxID=6550 RepID=A0A8S3R769_MYTED|nr:unnamed protein product [Mytilus edulis]